MHDFVQKSTISGHSSFCEVLRADTGRRPRGLIFRASRLRSRPPREGPTGAGICDGWFSEAGAGSDFRVNETEEERAARKQAYHERGMDID